MNDNKKYVLEILNSETKEIIRTETYNNIKEISRKYNIPYHQLRGIQDSKHTTKQRLQDYSKELTSKMKLYKNPECKIEL